MTTQFLVKVLISAFVIAGVSELAKRYSVLAAILASLPLTSILAFCWLYWETSDVTKVIELSQGIFWAVLPSLVFFVAMPLFLKAGYHFVWSLLCSCLLMTVSYGGYVWILRRFGVLI
jgi:hypothetical protein